MATLNRDKNLVEIKAEEVVLSEKKDEGAMRRPLKASKIVVHLNAQMLDLDKEVTVRLNGKVAYKGMVERSRGTMMQNLVKRGDVNSAFPAEVIVGEK